MRAAVIAVCAVLAVTLFGAGAEAAIPGDQITSLPGFSGNFPSQQYSGFLEVGPGRYLHYWFVESENKPSTDPVVLWMNGGPGCSSLDGFFYEHGPYHFANPHATLLPGAVPQLMLNPNRWTQIANVIFLEAPAGVGFSYSTDGNYTTDDNTTAIYNFKALQAFFQSFPEFAQNDFYISGESYAGVYVPTLVEQVMINNDAGVSSIPLKGFLVGNGCIGNVAGVCGNYGTQIRADFLAGHGLYEPSLHQQIMATCNFQNPSVACDLLLAKMSNEVGDVNMYDIYADCISGEDTRNTSRMWRIPPGNDVQLMRTIARMGGRVGGPDECIDGIDAEAYLNDPTVQAAIHVTAAGQSAWSICTSIPYNGNIDSLLPLYPTLISRYRTLIYNGDVDCCVPWSDNQMWTSSLGYAVADPWRPWKVNGQVAGYVTVYSENNFTFLTVKGAGHMVPQYKPVQAFAMFQRFLSNSPF